MLSAVYIASSPGPVVSKITLGHQLGLGKIVGVVGIHFFFLRIPMTGKAERNTLAESIERVWIKIEERCFSTPIKDWISQSNVHVDISL